MARIAKGNSGKKPKLRNQKLVNLNPSPTIAPTICNPVTSGFSSTPTSSQATLAWADSGAVQYNVRYRPVGSTQWTTTSTPSVNIVITNLSASTPYEWEVQSDCTDISLQSGWSATQTFSTVGVPPSSLTAGFTRYAKVLDTIRPEDFDLGNISEDDLEDNTNFKSAKLFCEGQFDRLQSVDYTTAHSGTTRWIKWVSPPGTCCNGSPWFCRIQAYRATNEQSSVIPDFESEEFFMDVTYYFPNTSLIDPPEPDWVASTGGKISPGITGQTGVGVTAGNPQQTGKYEMTFHWYGMQNNKGDYRNSTYTKTNSLTDFHLAASIYAADPRTVINNGSGYQMSLFFCDAGGTSRKVFTVGNEYRFRGWMRTNTPANNGPYDGMLRWELSTNGGAWEELITVTDFNWRGNFTTKLGQSGLILFRGGGFGWLVGYSNSYPTTIHETNIYMKDYLTGSFALGNNDPTGRPSDLGDMFSFIPADSISKDNITNVLWEVKNTSTQALLYSGNGAPDAISSTGNFWHGRWIWPIIDLDPAFTATSGGDVDVCKTITDDNGNVSNPFCITYSQGVYDSGALPVTCDAPGNLQSTVTTTTATLTWTGDSDTINYAVEYRESGTGNWVVASTTSTSFQISGLTPGTQYDWRIQSDCTGGVTSGSTGSTFTTDSVAVITCDTPSNTSLVSSSQSTLNVTWNGDTDAVSYNIRYRQAGTSNWTTITSTNNTVSISSLSAGTSYEIQVQSVCSGTSSGFSNTVTFNTQAGSNPNASFNVLMSVDDGPSPDAADTALGNILINTGRYNVTYATDNDLDEDAVESYDLVIFGPSSTSHGQSLRWSNVNLVFTTHEDMNQMWVANQSATNTSSNTINITDASHPVTAQFGTGPLQIFTNNYAQANSSQDAPGMQRLAQNTSNGNTSIGVFDYGGARYEWWTLGRVATLPFSSSGAQNLTSDGEQLFINACDWAAAFDHNLTPNIPPYGLTSYDEDNGIYRLIASRSLEHPEATYLFTLANATGTGVDDYVLSRSPYITADFSGKFAQASGVALSFDNRDYKILIYDESSSFNHNHGDEAEDLMNDIADMLNQTTNTNFTVERSNSKVESDELFDHDLLVLASTTGTNQLNAAQRLRIEEFVNQGGSVISVHAASDAYWHSTANGGNTGVWDYYAESIVGASVQRSPNHTSNNTPGTLSITPNSISNLIDTYGFIIQSKLPNSWSHNEEYYYWEDGYLSPNFLNLVDVGSTGSGSQNDPRNMARYYNHPGGGLMFYTALAHNSSTWDSDTEFRQMIENAVIAAWAKTHFTSFTPQVDIKAVSSSSDDTGAGGTTYYVAETAVGAGDGSSELNAMNLSTAQTQWNTGASNDTYLFKRGDTFYSDGLTITSGGTGVGNELTLGAYGTSGAKPKFVGSHNGSGSPYTLTSFTTGNSATYANPTNPVYELSINSGLSSDIPTVVYYSVDDGASWKRVPRARSANYFADGGSGAQLVDNDLASNLPLTMASLTPGEEVRVHWKADLYTWEWDVINPTSISGGTYPFSSGSHTTGVSTSFPYYVESQDRVTLLGEGRQDLDAFTSLSDDEIQVRFAKAGRTPTDVQWRFINESTAMSINASHVVLKNLDFDGWERECVYMDGGRTNVNLEDCILQNTFGAGVYNEFDSEFDLSRCLIHNIDGVGVYINSSQDTGIGSCIVSDIGLDGGQIWGVRSIPGRAQNQFHSAITGFGKTTGGMENLVADGNHVFNIGYNGIRFDGANNSVSNNYIVACMLELSDGGGIYSFGGNATAYTTGCSVTDNIVIYCPGNLNDTSKNPDRNLAEGIYLDNGNDSTLVSGNFIAYAGGWGALSNFDNIDCTWDNNTFYGSSRFGLLTFDSTAPASNNNDNNVTNNFFITWHPDHSPVIALNRTGPVGSYQAVDTSDNNTYITLYNQRPAHENVSPIGRTYTEWVSYGARYHETLASWQSASSLDGSSTETLYGKTFTTRENTINEDTVIAVYLSGVSNFVFDDPTATYAEPDGTTHVGNVSIINEAKILIKV